MRAEIIVAKNGSLYRIERGRATAEASVAERPQLKINFNGGAIQVSMTSDEAFRLAAELMTCAEYHSIRKTGQKFLLEPF
ncbi:MAG: hypothetical protein ABI042_05635 [Verrucomicrobiota bacterium]